MKVTDRKLQGSTLTGFQALYLVEGSHFQVFKLCSLQQFTFTGFKFCSLQQFTFTGFKVCSLQGSTLMGFQACRGLLLRAFQLVGVHSCGQLPKLFSLKGYTLTGFRAFQLVGVNSYRLSCFKACSGQLLQAFMLYSLQWSTLKGSQDFQLVRVHSYGLLSFQGNTLMGI